MDRKQQDALRAREVDALEEIGDHLRALNDRPREARPGRSAHMRRFPALRMSLAFCRDVRGVGDVEGLAQLMRRVPDEYVDRAERAVRCVCGASVPFGDLAACPGSCGRWFAADESGAWAVRFDADAQA
jgi:hypothetical protein